MANKKSIRNNKLRKSNKVNQTNSKTKKRFVYKVVTNARQKIMQKKRRNVVDARDILVKMTKKQDAKDKLFKIGETKKNGNVQVIGKSILRKIGSDGKIALFTNKAKKTNTDINLAIKQQLGLIPQVRSPKKIVKKAVLTKPVAPALIGKTTPDDVDYDYKRPPRNYEEPRSLYKWIRPDLKTSEARRRPLVSRGREFENGTKRPPRNYEEPRSLYKWIRPDVKASEAQRKPLVSRGREFENGTKWMSYQAIARSVRPPPNYADLDALPPARQSISLEGSSRSSNVRSRLDTYLVQTQSHGILAQGTTKTKVVAPVGRDGLRKLGYVDCV